MKDAPKSKVVKATPVPKAMISVGRASYIKLVRTVRNLEAENDKLITHMKVISEAAHESQTRSHVYNKREDAPEAKRVHGRNGKPIQGRNTGQLLRGKDAMSVDGIQIPILNSTPYKPRFTKSPSKTKSAPDKMAQKGPH